MDALDLAGRESSAATVMFHTALAARRGLSATEEKALDILLRDAPLTHAELMRATGLRPASVSDLLDRLEQKGYASRGPHPDDGRRILISADADRVYRDLTPLFEPWLQQLHHAYERFTDRELARICDFLLQVANSQRDAAEHLAHSHEPNPPTEPGSAL